MRPNTILLAIATLFASVAANCNDPSASPDNGDIALYYKTDCRSPYLNVGAIGSCQDWPDFDACSAITRKGVVCDIYKQDGCDKGYIATIDSAGHRDFCGFFTDTVQSVRCREA